MKLVWLWVFVLLLIVFFVSYGWLGKGFVGRVPLPSILWLVVLIAGLFFGMFIHWFWNR